MATMEDSEYFSAGCGASTTPVRPGNAQECPMCHDKGKRSDACSAARLLVRYGSVVKDKFWPIGRLVGVLGSHLFVQANPQSRPSWQSGQPVFDRRSQTVEQVRDPGLVAGEKTPE